MTELNKMVKSEQFCFLWLRKDDTSNETTDFVASSDMLATPKIDTGILTWLHRMDALGAYTLGHWKCRMDNMLSRFSFRPCHFTVTKPRHGQASNETNTQVKLGN